MTPEQIKLISKLIDLKIELFEYNQMSGRDRDYCARSGITIESEITEITQKLEETTL